MKGEQSKGGWRLEVGVGAGGLDVKHNCLCKCVYTKSFNFPIQCMPTKFLP